MWLPEGSQPTGWEPLLWLRQFCQHFVSYLCFSIIGIGHIFVVLRCPICGIFHGSPGKWMHFQTLFSFILRREWWFSLELCWELKGLESLKRDLLDTKCSANIYSYEQTLPRILTCLKVQELTGPRWNHPMPYTWHAMGKHTIGELTKPSDLILTPRFSKPKRNKVCSYLLTDVRECFGQLPGAVFRYSESFLPSQTSESSLCAVLIRKICALS